MTAGNGGWFTETLHADVQLRVRIERSVYRGRTRVQAVEIFENTRLGRVLCLDGVVQTTEADEFYYHEMLVHPALLAVGGGPSVLIIGGADGGALRQVLKHPARGVTLVDIDEELIGLCRTHLPAIAAGAFADPRVQVVLGDGIAFAAETKARFDVVIVDSTDPIGPSRGLFEAPFFHDCRRVLEPGGLLITQSGAPFYQLDELARAHGARREAFPLAGVYAAAVPMYGGGLFAFGWASAALDLAAVPAAGIERGYRERGLETRYYRPGIHAAAFALPNELAQALKLDG